MNKLLLTVLAAVAVAGAAVYFLHPKEASASRMLLKDDMPTPAWDAWNHWKQNHRSYGTDAEAEYRRGIWYNNYKIVMEHNSRQSQYTLDLNDFADMTVVEFAKQKKGFKGVQAKRGARLHKAAGVKVAPVDWRKRPDILSPVQDQGQCGSCWAFSATASMESANALATGTLIKLSEQQLVDCSHNGNQGCEGGLMDQAFQWAESHKLDTEKSYPYAGVDERCKNKAGVVEPRTFTDVDATDAALEEAVAKQPISIAVAANSAWQLYSGGILPFDQCPDAQLDHGVVLVGFTDDAWIVRNSWAASWGEEGYIRLAKGQNICGIRNS